MKRKQPRCAFCGRFIIKNSINHYNSHVFKIEYSTPSINRIINHFSNIVKYY